MKTVAIAKAIVFAGTCALLAVPIASVRAQQPYPSKPIHLISSQAVGGGVDALTRTIGQALQDRTGHGFTVEARPGANGVLAANACAAAKPDGYTICLVNPQFNFVPLIFNKPPYDAQKQFEPVTLIVNAPYALGLQKSVSAKSIEELVAYSKANPGKLNYVSLGHAHPVDFAVERLMSELGVAWTPIPYKGAADSMAAFAAGDVHIMLITTPNVSTSVKAGHGQALFVTGKKRVAQMPDVPTLAQSGRQIKGVEGLWFGLIAPAGTPKEVLTKLAGEVAAIVRLPSIRDRAEALGFELVGSTPAEFASQMAEERARAADLLKGRPKLN